MEQDPLVKLKAGNYQVDGRPFLLRYNPPFTSCFMRYNKVAVRVKNK